MSEGDFIQQDIRLINLYSQSATTLFNGTLKSSVSFNFKNLLIEDANIMYTTIGVSTAQFPVSFYTINEYNNALATSVGNITLLKGNYTSSSLIAELKPKLIALGLTTMQIYISKITGRLTFSAATFNFDFLANGSTIFDILGLETNLNYSSIANVIECQFPLNLLGIQQLRINSTALSSYNSNSTTLGESNLISVIQNTAPPFGMCLYNNTTSYSILKNKTIANIDIQILDENNNPIDFNNVDWTMTIQISIFRKIRSINKNIAFLNPILDTLENIQNTLAKTTPDDSEPSTTDSVEQDLLANDANSLEIMEYNNLI